MDCSISCSVALGLEDGHGHLEPGTTHPNVWPLLSEEEMSANSSPFSSRELTGINMATEVERHNRVSQYHLEEDWPWV